MVCCKLSSMVQIVSFRRPLSFHTLQVPFVYQFCNMQSALFTTPLPLVLIPPNDRVCSICLEPYIEPSQPAATQQDQQGEWAVRVELVAETSGLRRCCGHIIGKQCLEAHIRSSGPWKRRCPLCRALWFQESRLQAEQTQITSRQQAQPESQTVVGSRPLLRSTGQNRSRSPQNEWGESSTSQELYAQHLASFTQRVRDKLEIKDGSDEVGKSLEEVEQVLGDFYNRSGVAETRWPSI